jgi:hypothetical protein
MSPELVLVDEALRPAALAALPEYPDVFTALKQRRSGDPIRQLRAGLTISEPISSSATDGRASWLSRGLVVAAVCASPVTSIGLAFTTGASAPRSARLSRIEAARHRASWAKRALGAGAAVAFAAAAGLAWSGHSGNTASSSSPVSSSDDGTISSNDDGGFSFGSGSVSPSSGSQAQVGTSVS